MGFVAQRPRIYVEYHGRLGNQLFQYALAKSIAERIQGEVINVDWIYRASHGTRPAIQAFQLEARSPDLIDECVIRLVTGRTGRRIGRIISGIIPKMIVDKEDGFNVEVNQINKSVYLRGYWQSYRYFDMIAEKLFLQMKPRLALSDRTECARTVAQSDGTVVIHVRRGDYIHNPGFSEIFVSHGKEFYMRALQLFAKVRPIERLIVVSDDPVWCRENLRLGYSTFVMEQPPLGDWEDLWLMASARRIVIAASSFSWWAGWLVYRKGGAVVAPMVWRQGAEVPPRDLIPHEWHLI